jgi:hypothetical protein
MPKNIFLESDRPTDLNTNKKRKIISVFSGFVKLSRVGQNIVKNEKLHLW